MRCPPQVSILIVAILVIIGAQPAQAQYRFDHWTADDGLPQNSVYAITQTHDGYLWLATVDGLVRFDGVRFTVFDQSNSAGLKSNRFTCLFEDAQGTLWSGTEDGGLTRYRDGQFRTFTTVDGLPTNEVKQIQADPNGGLLIATTNGWVKYANDRFSPDSRSGNWYDLKIRFARSGSEWRYDKDGLHQFNKGDEHTYPIFGRVSDASLFESRDGTFWAGIPTEKLARVSNGELRVYTTADGLPPLPPDAAVGSFMEDRQGNLWLGTANGLVRFQNGRFTTYTTADGLSSNGILSLYEDREGTMWIGTTTGGLNRLTRQFITSYSTRDGLAGDNVYPIYQDRDGAIWLGTRSLCFFKDGVIKDIAGKAPYPDALREVQAIAQDQEGRLWVSSYENIAYLENGRINQPNIVKTIPGAQAIYADRERNVWFGTKNGVFKLAGDKLTTYDTPKDFPGKDVKVIHQDRNGAIWLGTYSGLVRLTRGAFQTYSMKDGLGSDRVRSIYEDADGILWIGTYDGGLSRLKDGRITTYKVTEGLFNNGVFQILEDGRGNFWMSSNRGIYRVSRQQLNDFAEGRIAAINCIAYGKLDGMLNTECNGGRQPAGIKANDGRLWFPTQGGVVVIDPEAVPFNNEPPPVLIEMVNIDGAAVRFIGGLTMKPGQSSLEIHFTGLSFIKPEQVRFKYQLIGQDADWVNSGTRRSVNYSYLPPGQYTFRVIATNSDGIWNQNPVTMRITVLPPFYRTWWFVSIVLLFIVGLAAVAYTIRVNQLKRLSEARELFSQQLIESQEGERKRIAAELHDSIGQSLLIIKNRAYLGLHDDRGAQAAREQLEEISESVSSTLQEVRAIAQDLRPPQMERVGLTTTLEEMLARVATASDIDFTYRVAALDGVFSPAAEINFFRVVQESINNIIKHSEATSARIEIVRTPSGVLMEVVDNGKGFVPAEARANGTGRSFGLTGMAERVRMLEGEFSIQSAPGKGTRITVSMAINQKGRKGEREKRSDQI